MSAPSSSHSSGSSRPVSIRQATWLGAALLAGLFTFVAFTQQPRTDARRHVLGPLDWLVHPISRNNFAHQPTVTQNMRAIAALDGTPLAWVVGDGNLIIRTTDGGKTWQQGTIDFAVAAAASDPNADAERAAAEKRNEAARVAIRDSIRQYQRRLVALDSTINAYQMEQKAEMSKQQANAAYRRQTSPESLYSQRTSMQRELQRLQRQLAANTTTQDSAVPEVPTPPSVVNLHDVHFITASQGWAVGDYGVLLSTTDSGHTWKHNPPLRAARLAFVHFADARNGVVVAPDERATFTTADGGTTWSRRSFPADTMRAVGIAGDTLLWLTVDTVRAWLSRDVGKTWVPNEIPFNLSEQDERKSLEIAGVRWRGLSAATRLDVGQLLPGVSQRFNEFYQDSIVDRVLPYSDTVAVFVGSGDESWLITGGLYHTTNRGRSWSRVVARHQLGAIHFFDQNNGWAASDGGVLLRTADGGKTWKSIQTNTANDFEAIFFVDRRTGYARTNRGEIFRTLNGRTWEEPPANTPLAELQLFENRSVSLFDSIGVIVQTDGSMRRVRKVNNVWESFDTLTNERYNSASFVDPQYGTAVNEFGTILLSADSGRTWLPSTNSTLPTYIARFDRDSLFVLEHGSLRIATVQDLTGTVVFSSETPARVAVAPWYYLAMVLLLILALLLSRTEGDVRSAIEGRFASDRPLEPEDRDDLGVKPIARALSRFLRNTRTRPPLTLAVTGKWGSGKSSLLNLTQADLRKYGLRPVWFNAWHHQKEDSLLAALLDTIRKDAVPPVYTFAGLLFRARLYSIRLRRHWWAFALLLLPGYFFARLFFSETGAFDFLHTLNLLAADLAKLAKGVGAGGEPFDVKLLGQSVTVLIWPIIAITTAYNKILRAFGVNPAALLSARAGTGNVRDLSAQTGFRHEFAREFRDVTRALGIYRLVIIVDDLDRCRPTNVLDVLEAINFLVSSGECFVLLGIDRDQVVSYVGMAFKDAAAELAAQSIEHPDSPFVGKSEAYVRSWYAQEYLEKLINLDIAVPLADAEKVKDVLAPQPVIPLHRPRVQWRERVKPTRTKVAAAAVAFILATSSFIAIKWGGDGANPRIETAVSDSTTSTPDTTTPAPVSTAPAAPVAQRDTAAVDAPAATIQPVHITEARLIDPAITDRRVSGGTIALVLFALILLWRFLQQRDPVVRDSDSFVLGIRACGPLVFGKRQTPRAAKKFLNRVRYYAMRQRPEEPDARVIDSIGTWINQKIGRTTTKPNVPPQRPGYDQIPEELLVALAAVHDHDARWTSYDEFWADPPHFLAANLTADMAGDLPNTLGLFGDITKYRDDFDALVCDIR